MKPGNLALKKSRSKPANLRRYKGVLMIEWKDDYRTGFTSIDDEHKDLFKHINDLEMMVNSQALDLYKLEATFVFLEAYCNSHFEHEEKCMHKHQCAVAEINKNAHEKFRQELLVFQKDFSAQRRNRDGAVEVAKKVLEMSSGWIANHICKIDVELRNVKKTAPDQYTVN